MEELRVLLLLSVQQVHFDLVCHWVLDFIPHDFDILEQHHGLKRAMLHRLDGVLHTEGDHLRVKGDLLEELADDFLLVHELHVSERVLRESNCLVEALVHTVADINGGDDAVLDALIEVIALLQHELQVGTTSDDDTAAVCLIVRDEVLLCKFTALDNIVVALFFTQTGKTHG